MKIIAVHCLTLLFWAKFYDKSIQWQCIGAVERGGGRVKKGFRSLSQESSISHWLSWPAPKNIRALSSSGSSQKSIKDHHRLGKLLTPALIPPLFLPSPLNISPLSFPPLSAHSSPVSSISTTFLSFSSSSSSLLSLFSSFYCAFSAHDHPLAIIRERIQDIGDSYLLHCPLPNLHSALPTLHSALPTALSSCCCPYLWTSKQTSTHFLSWLNFCLEFEIFNVWISFWKKARPLTSLENASEFQELYVSARSLKKARAWKKLSRARPKAG